MAAEAPGRVPFVRPSLAIIGDKMTTQVNERDHALGKINQIDALARGVLGALMFSPGLLEICELRDVDFPVGRFRETFSAIAALWEEGRPAEIDPVILAERVGGDGAVTFIGSVFDGNIKIDEPTFRGRTSELRKRALTVRVLAKIEGQAKSGELDLDEIRGDLETYDQLEGKAFDPAGVMMTGDQLQALKIEVEWTLDKLIPSRSLTLLHGPGGVGKTWLALAIGQAVSEGVPFLGLPTVRRPVSYIDFENPWPMLIKRVRHLNIHAVNFWHLSAEVRPPKLDGPDWAQYKSLPAGSLLIFDTARSCHEGDENSSQDVGLVMNRLKEIREKGNDIILLHHTPRINERASKGSTAWEDLADHVLAFYKVRRGSLKEIKEEIDAAEFDPDALFSLGTGKKTRYEPFRLYVTFDASLRCFVHADSPDKDVIDALAEYIVGQGSGKNQSEIIAWAKSEGIGPSHHGAFAALLNRGEREGRWRSHKGFRGAKFYEPT